jgi:hypothetical protein
LQQARRYLAAADKKLQEAYATGDENLITRCSRIWEKASDTYHAARRDAEAAQKARGEFVSRSGVSADLGQLLELFLGMSNSRANRIIARCGDLSPEIEQRIRESVQSTNSDEQALLQRLPLIVSAEEIPFELVPSEK